MSEAFEQSAAKPAAKKSRAQPDWQAEAKRSGWRPGGKRLQGWEQLNVLVPGDVRRAARAKALQTDRDLSGVVTDLLKEWIAD
jgi:hypothetical protein